MYFSTGRNFGIFWRVFKILIWHAQTLDLQLLFLTSLFFTGVGAFCVELQHLQIQGCHFLKSALNLDLTLSDDGECRTFFDSPRNYWFRCFLRRVMVIFRQQKNFGPNVIYFVAEHWRVPERVQVHPNVSRYTPSWKGPSLSYPINDYKRNVAIFKTSLKQL